jgi:hypothetical protein
MDGYIINPASVQGDIDLGLIDNYGLPLADGMISELGAGLQHVLQSQMMVEGYGAVTLLQVTCDNTFFDYNGTYPMTTGSGIHYSDLVVGPNTFNTDVQVRFPTAQVEGTTSTAVWSSQNCHIHGKIGFLRSLLQFTVDEWGVVSAGKAQKLFLTDGSTLMTGNSTTRYADEFLNIIGDHPDVDILLAGILRTFDIMFNDVWYPITQIGSISNILSWSPGPDGNYAAQYTWRGLSAAVGATLHQVYLQSDTSATRTCNYYGQTGAGTLALNSCLIWLATGLLGLVMVIFVVYGVFVRSVNRIKNPDSFQMSLFCLLDDKVLMLYTASWIGSLSRSATIDHNGMPQTTFMKEVQVRLGEKKGQMEQRYGDLWIGPKTDTLRMRPSRRMVQEDTKLEEEVYI